MSPRRWSWRGRIELGGRDEADDLIFDSLQSSRKVAIRRQFVVTITAGKVTYAIPIALLIPLPRDTASPKLDRRLGRPQHDGASEGARAGRRTRRHSSLLMFAISLAYLFVPTTPWQNSKRVIFFPESRRLQSACIPASCICLRAFFPLRQSSSTFVTSAKSS